MADISKKRKEIENTVYTTMKLLDPNGYNEDKYKKLFSKMSDAQFTRWINKLLSEEDNNFRLEITPFENGGTDLKFSNIKRAADYLGVPLDEYIYMPFMNPNGEPVRSRDVTPVGYVHTKRLEQLLSKKNAYSSEISSRNSKTGQVSGADKNGRISDIENYSLLTIGATEALKEFMSARSDDMVQKQEMLQDITRDGYTSMSNYTYDIENKTALNTLDMYYMGSGLITDLITSGYALKKTLDGKENVKERLQDAY